VFALVLVTTPLLALTPDDELWIPAAARGEGREGSFWMTDLYLLNLGEDEVTVEITWLERDEDNAEAEGQEYVIAGGETLALEDVILDVFGHEEAYGALHIEAVDEPVVAKDDEGEEDGDDEVLLVANARVYNLKDGATYGQGVAGIIADAAISAEDGEPTHAIGVSVTDSFRTNWFGVNITEDEEGEPETAEVLVEVLDLAGDVLAAQTFAMPPMAPLLKLVEDLGVSDLDNGTLRFTMLEGEGIFGATKIDGLSNDGTTLEAHWQCAGDEDEDEFTDEFFIEDCTFVATGRNPFFVLEPGFELQLEGEDEGEQISLTITVLNETEEVDGVETRVVEERELADDELTEVSRNYFAICQESGSVFYFGEDVDIYDDGEIVSHDGAWRAGEDDAEAGIMMPGTILVGSRYMQEVAPGVALDRCEHVAMGITIDTDAGNFTDCLQVIDTSELEPALEDTKVYCPGVGLVVDEELELVELTDPAD